jgi:hypothetical protein
MKKDSPAFIETTIHIERIFCNSNKIDEILSQYQTIISSTYVKMEFKRRLIRDLVYLYNEVLLSADNFGDVLLRLKKLPPIQFRKLNIILGALAKYFYDDKEIESQGLYSKEFVENAISYFRQIIPGIWEDFNKIVNDEKDGTECYHAKTGLKLEEGKFTYERMNCKKSDIKCNIINFFNQNKEVFEKIYNNFSESSSLDEEQSKLTDILGKALKYPDNMADKNSCWKCGDAIIAAESPVPAILLSTNIKHFEPICSLIGKKTENPL